MTEKTFAHELGADVQIISQVKGRITGRAEYLSCEPQYRIVYVDAQGVPREEWWTQGLIQAA